MPSIIIFDEATDAGQQCLDQNTSMSYFKMKFQPGHASIFIKPSNNYMSALPITCSSIF